ncbi:MAG: response regulator [Candidatus Eisenbacteria bacterium]|nr:response regulator [Candidatus Eisenbacteria bacterium]
MKALVVDDSRAMRSIIGKYLRELGFEVFDAASGLQALVDIRKIDGLSLVLVDWNMPEMDGCEFLQKVRNEPQFQDVPIMMVTTESEMEQVAVALEAGANEYLMKPFDKQGLLEKLLLLGVDPGEQAA